MGRRRLDRSLAGPTETPTTDGSYGMVGRPWSPRRPRKPTISREMEEEAPMRSKEEIWAPSRAEEEKL